MGVKLKRIGVLKTSFFMGLYGIAVGLVLGIIMTLTTSFLIAADPLAGTILSFLTGFMTIIILPISFGIFGVITGLIFTPIMNLVLKIIKGIDLELVEEVGQMNQAKPAKTMQTQTKPVQNKSQQTKPSTMQKKVQKQQAQKPR